MQNNKAIEEFSRAYQGIYRNIHNDVQMQFFYEREDNLPMIKEHEGFNRQMHEEIAASFLNAEVDFWVGGGRKYFDQLDDDQSGAIDFEEYLEVWLISKHNIHVYQCSLDACTQPCYIKLPWLVL